MKPGSKYHLFTSKKETWEPDEAEQITVRLDPERQDGGGTVVKIERRSSSSSTKRRPRNYF